jgi:amino acid adenylation domain-containing protein
MKASAQLTADERQWIERVSGTGKTPYPAWSVPRIVAAQAVRTPDATAVRSGSQTLSYRELDEQADRLARRLCGAGWANRIVPVLMERSTELIVALLAVMKAGGAYLALDPEDPPERQRLLIEDCGADAVLVDAGYNGSLKELVPGDECDLPTVDTAAPAYVCYTSGSTGRPKGVVVPHRAVSRLVRHPNWITVKPDDRFLQLAPVAFDASTLEIWMPLAHGATLEVFRPGPVDLGELATTVTERDITVMWLTAGLFHRFVAGHLAALTGVRHIIAGGDRVSAGHVRRLLAAHPGIVFTNGYGPTENTTFTTCWVATEVARDAESLPIGRPVDGTRVAVLDPTGQPVPRGIVGELHAAGEGVALGYLNRPLETEQSFRPDAAGGLIYRTGDLVRWNDDGVLEFIGRVDDQVKIRGFRVEPSAVEAALLRRQEVQVAAVVAQPQPSGDKQLIAYVVPASEDPYEWPGLAVWLRQELHDELPSYSVPWTVIIRAELPHTPSGKVDRQALPAVSRAARNVWNEFVAPRDDRERSLADLWGDVLSVEPVGIEDDFFDLGGNSLLAGELLARVHSEHGLHLPARTLYLQPTIANLVNELNRREAGTRRAQR